MRGKKKRGKKNPAEKNQWLGGLCAVWLETRGNAEFSHSHGWVKS